ncbi:unnamed protein product, partial [Choristocarpus tenellus]
QIDRLHVLSIYDRFINRAPPYQGKAVVMSVVEKLETLRSMGICGNERQLQSLLRAADYNLERALNQYFESGIPDISPVRHGSASTKEIQVDESCGDDSSRRVERSCEAYGIRKESSRQPSLSFQGGNQCSFRATQGSNAGGGNVTVDAGRRWPKLVGERWVTGYSTSRGSMEYGENVVILTQGSASQVSSSPRKGGSGKSKGRGGGISNGRGAAKRG